MFQICILLLVLLSFPSTVLGIRRFIREKTMLTFGLMLWAVTLTATFIRAAFHYDNFKTMVQLGEMLIGFHIPMTWMVSSLFLVGLVSSLTTFVFVRLVNSANFRRYVVGLMIFILLCNLCAGIVASLVLKQSVDQCFFESCCASMAIVGVSWGFTYKEICVLVNIYLQAIICLLSALWVFWCAIRAYSSRRTLPNMLILLMGFVIGIIYVVAFVGVCLHYAMPMTDAYNLCYKELIELAREYHTTYNKVNYLIFIIGFLVAVISNLLVGTLIKMRIKRINCNTGK